MDIIYRTLEELKPYEKNPRKNDAAVDAVAASIKEFGFRQPIVIDKDNVIVCGHTRYKALKKLGWAIRVPCVMAEDLTDEQIRAYRIADNKAADLSIWDNRLLLEELEGLGDIFTGFSESELFDGTIDDVNASTLLEDNERGVVYEVVIRTADEEKARRIALEYSE